VVATALALGLAASTKPELAIAAGGGAVFFVVAARSLPAAFCLFVVATFFDRGTASLHTGGVTIVKLLGAVLTLVWLVKTLAGERSMPLLARHEPVLAFASMLFIGWAIASANWAEARGEALFGSAGSAFRLAQGILLLFIVYSTFTERRHVWWLLRSFVAGAMFAALIGIFGVYGTSASVNDARLSGGFDDPNELAAVLVAALVFSGFAFVALRGRASRWLYAVAALIFLYALAQTDSQAGLVALAVALVLAVVLGGPARPIIAVGVLAFVFAAVTYYTFVTKPVALQTISSQDNVGSRESLWSVAAQVVRDHPIAGVGAGNFVVVEPEYAFRDIDLPRVDLIVRPELVHNSYLQVLTELGVIGLAAFLAVIARSLQLALRAAHTFARWGDYELDMLSRGFLIGTVGMLVAYFFATNQYEKQLWLLLGAGPALLSVALRAHASAIQDLGRRAVRPAESWVDAYRAGERGS
jgi:putative inorganic carbon (HCO3(-)) transporter